MDKPTMGERLDAISAEMDAAYADRRDLIPGSGAYHLADAQIERAYRDLRLLTVEMNGQHVTTDDVECWCEPKVVAVP